MISSLGPISSYETVIFDCDGVIFNSNLFKVKEFLSIAEKIGPCAKISMQKILSKYQGESRYFLFKKFIDSFPEEERKRYKVDEFIETFAKGCLSNYKNVERSKNISKLIKLIDANTMVVSSSDTIELKDLFIDLDLYKYFDSGIYGSPETKFQIISREISSGRIKPKVLYFGDGKIDIEVCDKFGFDLIFVTDWTAMEDYKKICSKRDIFTIKSLDSYFLTQTVSI